MPTKTLMDSDRKIAKLSYQEKKVNYPVQDGSGVFLVHKGNSKNFILRKEFPIKSKKYVDLRLGKWNNNRTAILEQVDELKVWINNNPFTHPKKFFEKSDPEKTLGEAFKRYTAVLKAETKERTWKDRLNKLVQMEAYFGKDTPLSEFEGVKGRDKVLLMLDRLFFSKERYYHAKRCRGLLKQVFEYCIDKNWMKTNPAFRPDPDERIHKEQNNAHITWKEVPEFLSTLSERTNDKSVSNLAVKAYLMMGIRVGALVRLEWSWFNKEKDLWEIPAQTTGLKNLKENTGKEFNHLIPSTPELAELMNKVHAITGWQKYVFIGDKQTHLHEETINKFLKRIDARQSAHGWRSVFTEGCQENKFSWDIVQRCLGHREHKQGTRGHYDHSILLNQRRSLMEFWTKTLVDKGLTI